MISSVFLWRKPRSIWAGVGSRTHSFNVYVDPPSCCVSRRRRKVNTHQSFCTRCSGCHVVPCGATATWSGRLDPPTWQKFPPVLTGPPHLLPLQVWGSVDKGFDKSSFPKTEPTKLFHGELEVKEHVAINSSPRGGLVSPLPRPPPPVLHAAAQVLETWWPPRSGAQLQSFGLRGKLWLTEVPLSSASARGTPSKATSVGLFVGLE